ncbi:MAG: RNA-binding S4 domain-containing protein [Proteobacteria bacterium]|nr:RNA-binding S4 domain-containing protein [Pseudomonadota bacterium]
MWLWCARVAKARSDCARLVEDGGVRLNRQPVAKAHAKLRIGDVLTMGLRGEVRVWRVMALSTRRGPAPEARLLYEEVPETAGEAPGSDPCAKAGRAAYRGTQAAPWDGDALGTDDNSGRDYAGDPPADLAEDRHQER